jgi:uncharacterized protein (TIGR02246 family)
MHSDEQAINEVFKTWHDAVVAGDAAKLRGLMAEDAVFLTPGNPPMRGREAFMGVFLIGCQQHRINYTYDVEELHVAGDLAYCSCHLAVTVTPLNGGSPNRLSGYTLTILRRQLDGSWVLSRDANLMAPVPG